MRGEGSNDRLREVVSMAAAWCLGGCTHDKLGTGGLLLPDECRRSTRFAEGANDVEGEW